MIPRSINKATLNDNKLSQSLSSDGVNSPNASPSRSRPSSSTYMLSISPVSLPSTQASASSSVVPSTSTSGSNNTVSPSTGLIALIQLLVQHELLNTSYANTTSITSAVSGVSSPSGSHPNPALLNQVIRSAAVYQDLSTHLTNLISFLISTLAYLPYEFCEEPLQIIYWINRNIPLLSSTVMTNTRSIFSQFGALSRGSQALQQQPGTHEHSLTYHQHLDRIVE